jgi:hypothetical protein
MRMPITWLDLMRRQRGSRPGASPPRECPEIWRVDGIGHFLRGSTEDSVPAELAILVDAIDFEGKGAPGTARGTLAAGAVRNTTVSSSRN